MQETLIRWRLTHASKLHQPKIRGRCFSGNRFGDDPHVSPKVQFTPTKSSNFIALLSDAAFRLPSKISDASITPCTNCIQRGRYIKETNTCRVAVADKPPTHPKQKY